MACEENPEIYILFIYVCYDNRSLYVIQLNVYFDEVSAGLRMGCCCCCTVENL